MAEFTLPGAEAHYPPDLTLEPVHIDIDLRVEVEAARASGTVTHTIRAHAPDARTLRLHAVDFEEVHVEDTDGRPLVHRYDGRELSITWEEAFETGEERRVAIRYRIVEPRTGLFFSRPLAAYPDRAFYAATDHETERARHWLPTIDLPNVRPTLDFHLRADARFTILAAGTLQREEEHGDGTKTAHWRLEQPCPSYLTCFAIGDFVRYDDSDFEGRPVAYFTTNHFAPADLERAFGRTRAMLAWMSKKLDCPFPYPKYYQFALPGFGGAMENISLVSWDDVFVLDATMAKEMTWLVDQVNVHEMAHSYFGDMVVCRDYAHAWLKESWATYVETLWLEDSKGDDEARYNIYTNIDAYAKEADGSYKRPIVTRRFNHSWQMYDRHLYPGGAARLHMLRKDLGDDVFFQGVQAYLKRYAHRVVETADFRRELEKASGRSLGRWFDQWVYGLGYPKLKATAKFDAKAGELTITIEQTQVDKKAGVELFDMPLDIGWVVDGTMHTQRIRLQHAKQQTVIRLTREPEQIRIDPHGRAVLKLDFNPGDDKLRRQLTNATDVVGRILAAGELCKTGQRANVEAVAAAWRSEPFWGVRVRFAEALAGTGSQVAVDALAEIIAEEEHPMVLEPLLRQAAQLRDPAIRTAVEQRLTSGLDLYRARQAALEVLGAQREDAPYELLVKATDEDDPYGMGPTGAFRALAGSRREEALDVLLAHTRPGATSNRSRPTAATAAGALASLLPRRSRIRTTEALADLLRDPIDRVRQGAMAGLAALGEARALPALEAYRTTVSAQEQVAVDRATERIRGAQEARSKAQEKELDELRTKVRKLEESLQRIEARLGGPQGPTP